MTKEKAVAHDDIELDDRCQARVALDDATIQAYADLYRDDVKLPALDVFEVDGALYLVDGWHRLAACRQIGKDFVRVRIVGSSNEIEDATRAALAANHQHGLRRSRADKRRAVRLALEAGLYEDLGSNRSMAKDLGVSHTFVSEQRAKWEAEQSGNVATEADVEAENFDLEAATATEPTDSEAPSERKPRKAKPSPFEAFKKHVDDIASDVAKFYEHGSEVHEAAQRFVMLVREHDAVREAG